MARVVFLLFLFILRRFREWTRIIIIIMFELKNIIPVEERRTFDYLYSNIFLYRIKILLLFQVSDLKFATTTEKKERSGMQ